MILPSFVASGVLLLFNVVHCQLPRVNTSCDCGHSNEGVADRIVGGVLAAPHIYPWIVAIFDKGMLHCGGVLINDRYVLTAGHCVSGMKRRDLTLGLGIHNVQRAQEEGLVLPAAQLILHEEFTSDSVHDFNDIALIKLKKPVKYSDTISPICLPVRGSEYDGRLVRVAGWGRVKTSGLASKYLRRADLRVMTRKECKNTRIGQHIEDAMLCAYGESKDACQGDSGGPLLYQRDSEKYETIGVVSWGMGCAQKGYPGVYVKNTEYLNWIYSHTTDAIYCMDK